MSKKKRLFGILLALPPLLLGLLYGGGYIAQFMRNYHEWEAAGGTPGNGTSPTVPSFAVSECLRAIFTMPYGIVGILICVGALVLLIVMVMRMGYSETGEYDKDRNFIYSKKGTYGTSGFMSEKEAEEIFDLRTSLKNHNGTIFGLLNGRYVCMPEESMLNKNVAVYGASGSMKTRAYCINRILQATVPNKDGKMESLIICDPKSELYEKTSELLRKTHTVKVFNLVCPENSDSWNCLAEIEGDELMAQRFCDVIIKNTGSERGDHFWDSAEMNLLKALVLYVEQGYPPERKNIGQVYRLLTHCDEKELNSLFNMLPSSHPAKAPYAIFQQASDTVRSGVIIGLGSRLQVFQNRSICNMTAFDEIDMELPGQQPCAYFCITSDQDSTFDFLSSLFLSFVFIKLVRYADKNCEGGKLPIPVHVLGEELTACGVIPDLSRKISVIRSRNISMSCVFQNLAGLQNRYPLNQWQEILGNSDVQLFLGCVDELTAKYISDRSGEVSVHVQSKAKQLGTWRISNYTPEYRETSGVGKRKLLTMDEVLRLPISKALIIIRGRKLKHSDNGDTQIETPEAGAQFKIWLKSSGSYEAADETERDLITIDEHGFGVSKDLPYGTYIVEQISGKEGAELLPAFEVYIKTHADIYSYIINNAPITALIDVVKKDATTGKVIPAAGIGFKIRDLQSGEFITQRINYPTPVDIDVFYTDNTGRLRLPEPLGYGEYELIEQTVGGAEGYVLDSTPVKFKVDGSAEVVVVEKYNQPQMGTITILKRGEVFATVTEQDGIYTPHYEVQGLAGAVFGVYAVEDTYTLDGTKRYSAGDKVATLTTAADGTAISEPLFLGKFELREEKAPYGMVLLKEPVQTELTYAGEQVKITTVSETAVNERQKVVISLLKKLESDNTYGVGLGEEYKNIRFGLYAAEPLTAADGTEIPQDGLLEIVGIDENGLAVFTADVPAGAKLYVKEVATDAHYLLSDAIYPVAFDYEDVSVAFVQLVINNGEVIENTIIRGSIHGLKVDEDNTPVAGAVFGLFKANETEFTEENALATATPGEDGVFTFENIPYGDWIVRELSCPAHLVLSEESYKVTVSEKDQIIEITVVNKFLTGKVQVRKVSSKDHDKLLSGAEFVLYLDVNGNKAYDPDIDTLYGELSEADTGVYELSGLKHGGYLLLETKAPDGFTKDDRYFYFPIQKDGETVIVENEIGVGFTNEPIPTPTPKYPDSPQTGDNSKLWLWILLASGSLTVLITVSIVSRKKRKAL